MANPSNGSVAPADVPEKLLKRFITELPHVLIIDDNAILLRTVREMFSGIFTVSIAVSNSQAFMAMERKKPDLILLDYEMPMVNGETTLKMIRDDENYKDIPVVFFTSSCDTEVVKKLISLGPDGYILKPPNKDVMIKHINKVLFERYAE